MSFKLYRNPPFRAEQVGSLLRPKELLDTKKRWDDGQASEQEVEKAEDKAIDWIVDEQLKLNYSSLTDGEYRRHMFWGSFFPGLEGYEEIKDPSLEIFRLYMPDIAAFKESYYKPADTMICTGKIKHKGSTYIPQLKYLQSKVPKDKQKAIKLTLAAPNWYHLRYRQGRAYPKEAYPGGDKEYYADIAAAFQAELQELYDNGLRNVQFDDPNLAYFCHEPMLKGWKEDSENIKTTDTLLDEYIDLYNACVSKAPADMHIGVHLCRGNFVGSRHFAEGGYDRIAVKLFKELNVHTYYLEYETARAGGFEPLKELPPNKNVILGVVSSKFAKMEDLEELKKRVYSAADFVAKGNGETRESALKRLGVSPQCGFASHSTGNAITHEDMFNKLKLVRGLADAIWPGEP